MLKIQAIAVITFVAGLTSANAIAANQCSARSGNETAAVLELYTSEGCNSCPPADKWVSSLAPSGFKPAQIVPLAFHVDYWDYIGWADRFADKEFGAAIASWHAQMARARSTRRRFLSAEKIFDLAFSNVKLNGTLKDINTTKPRADIGLELDASKPNR